MTIKQKFDSLKVGDPVKIVKEFKASGRLSFRSEMREQIGLTGVIIGKDSDDPSVQIEIKGHKEKWHWSMSSIEKAEETKPLSKEEIYLQLQNKWVELNDVKRGTKVRLVRSWEDGEGGYSTKNHSFDEDDLGESIVDGIYIEDGPCIVCEGFNAPYFCLEVVEDKSIEFTLMASDVILKHDSVTVKITEYGVEIKGSEVWDQEDTEMFVSMIDSVGADDSVDVEFKIGNYLFTFSEAKMLADNYHKLFYL